MRLKKEITLKEIMLLHQSDLEALESSNEICQSKHTNLKSNNHKTNETIKTNKKRYKQGKVIAKGILYVRQTQRVRMKDNWGIDILGPFPLAIRQMKYLIVAIEYFTKWIEAEPVAQITTHKVQHFVWKNIVCRFRVPRRLISDNGT